jgi:hypothetical protein
MKGWWKVVCASSTIAVIAAVGCSNTPPPIPRVALMTVMGPVGGMSADCGILTGTQLVIGDPGNGPYPNSGTPTFEQNSAFGGGTVKFDCSVIPDNAGGFKITGRAELGGGAPADKKGTFSLTGTMTPKATGGMSTNVNAAFTTQNGTFQGMNCTIKYIGIDTTGAECPAGARDPQGNLLCTQSGSMDVKAGAVWGSVFCSPVVNSSANPPRTCRAAATFRFENCLQAVQ